MLMQGHKCDLWARNLVWASLFFLAVGTFTSVSISAVSHILILLPGLYFVGTRGVKGTPASVWLMLGLFAVCVLSVFANLDIIEHPMAHVLKAKYFLLAFLSYYAYRETLHSERANQRIAFLLKLFLLASVVATLSGLVAVKTGYNPLKGKPACHYERACGLFGMYMTYGYGMGMLCSLLAGLFLWRDKVRHWMPGGVILAALIVSFAGLYFSLARGAWIGFFVSLPFLFLRKYKKGFFLAGLLASAIFGLSIAVSPSVRTMFFNRETSNDQRMSFFKAAGHAFQERPWLGYGHRNFEPHSKEIKLRYQLPYSDFGGHAHNNIIEFLASTGAIGVLLLLAWLFTWCRELYQNSSLAVSSVGLCFFVCFFASGLVQYTFGDGENLFFILNVYLFTLIPVEAHDGA